MARVLVVDDSIISRNSLKAILAQGGHEVAGEAGNGEDAVTLYQELRPDIVTLDITMPRVNGLECLRRIMAADATAKVVMVSALGQGTKVLEAMESGARHYLTKPFRGAVVLEAIRAVLAA
jgi:two-component system chemotaxis response regulator CheY